jgi:bifunctional ADP-heptose synthase (sugar kinase/adenylyltransferase)
VKSFGGMTTERLQEIVGRFSRSRIAVVGDFFLDKYLDVEPAWAEFSIETGKTAHQVAAIRTSPGAAGTVVCNLAALGAGTLEAVGFTGDDGESYDLRKGLASLGCGTDYFHIDPERMTPTYLKPRDCTDASLAGEHERYDTKNRRPTSPSLGEQIVRSLDALLPRLDAVIVLDQVEEADCGVVTAAFREVVADRAKRWPGVVFWGDSRLRIREFRNVIIKPNQFEALGTENPPPGYEVDLDQLAAALTRLRQTTAAPVVATRGALGTVVTDPEMTLVPGVAVEGPTDPTGAGDSATAGAVLALTAGATLPEAALVANLVASITVEQLATTGTARPDQLPERLERWRRQNG